MKTSYGRKIWKNFKSTLENHLKMSIHYKNILFHRRLKKGFSLIEMALAILVVSFLVGSVAMLLMDGLSMQRNSEKILLAVSLSETKMAQLLTRPDLAETSEKGDFGNNPGPYMGFKYNIKITREKIDLGKIQQTGKLSTAPALVDELPVDFQNAEKKESMGSSTVSQTGAEIEVFKIIVEITYPLGKDTEKIYRVQTFRKI